MARRARTESGQSERMRALGSGPHLWKVDVVVHARGIAEAQEPLITAVEALLPPEDVDVDVVTRDVETTYSYDMPPPDGSLGISCWVRASTVGEAADIAFTVVSGAATSVTGLVHPLWDLRIIPRAAITLRKERPEDPSHGRLRRRMR